MSKSILVIGSTNVDFLVKTEKLPALGETVTDGLFRQTFGGKGANQAIGAARAGGKVTFITCLGNDIYAGELIRNFKSDGIDTSYVFTDHEQATGSALIMLDNKGNNYLSVAPGSNYSLYPAHIDKAIDAFHDAELIVLQMEIPVETTNHIFELARKFNKKVIFNLAPARRFEEEVLKKTFVFVVNEVEASMVSGIKVESPEDAEKASEILLMKGPEIVLITLGAMGVFCRTGSGKFFIPAFKVNAVDTTGAGDIFCGSLAVALSESKSLPEAVRFACAASAISVTRLGAQPSAPIRSEIDSFANSGDSNKLPPN